MLMEISMPTLPISGRMGSHSEAHHTMAQDTMVMVHTTDQEEVATAVVEEDMLMHSKLSQVLVFKLAKAKLKTSQTAQPSIGREP